MITSKETLMTATQIDDKCIIADGVNNIVVNKEGEVRLAGIPAPTTAPDVDFKKGKGALVPGIDYSYLYSYFNKDANVESPPSPATVYSNSDKHEDVKVVKIEKTTVWISGDVKESKDAYKGNSLAVKVQNDEYKSTYEEWQYRTVTAYEYDDVKQLGKFTINREFFNVDPDEDLDYAAKIDELEIEEGTVGGKAKANNQIILDPEATKQNYDLQVITIVSGKGAGQRRIIIHTEVDDDGRVVCTVNKAFKPAPKYVDPDKAPQLREAKERKGYKRRITKEGAKPLKKLTGEDYEDAVKRRDERFYKRYYSSQYVIVDMLKYKGLIRRGVVNEITTAGGYKLYKLDSETAKNKNILYEGRIQRTASGGTPNYNKIFLEPTKKDGDAIPYVPGTDELSMLYESGARFRIIAGEGEGFDAKIKNANRGTGDSTFWITVDVPNEVVKRHIQKMNRNSRFVIYFTNNIIPDDSTLPHESSTEKYFVHSGASDIYVNQIKISKDDDADLYDAIKSAKTYATSKPYPDTLAATISAAYVESYNYQAVYRMAVDISGVSQADLEKLYLYSQQDDAMLGLTETVPSPGGFDYDIYGSTVTRDAVTNEITSLNFYVIYTYIDISKYAFPNSASVYVVNGGSATIARSNGVMIYNSKDTLALDISTPTVAGDTLTVPFTMPADADDIKKLENYCSGGVLELVATNNDLDDENLVLAIADLDMSASKIKCHYFNSVSINVKNLTAYLHEPSRDNFIVLPVEATHDYSTRLTITSCGNDGNTIVFTFSEHLPLNEDAEVITTRTYPESKFLSLSTSESFAIYEHSFTDGIYTGWKIAFYDNDTVLKGSRKKKKDTVVSGYIDATGEVYVDNPPRGIVTGTQYVMWTEFTRSIGSRLILHNDNSYLTSESTNVDSEYTNRFFGLDYFASMIEDAYKNWRVEILHGWSQKKKGKKAKELSRQYYNVTGYTGRERTVDIGEDRDRIFPVPHGDEFVHIFDPDSSIFKIIDNPADDEEEEGANGQESMYAVISGFQPTSIPYVSHIRIYRASESTKAYLLVDEIDISKAKEDYEDTVEEPSLGEPIDISKTNIPPAKYLAQTKHVVAYAGGVDGEFDINLFDGIRAGRSIAANGDVLLPKHAGVTGVLSRSGTTIEKKFSVLKVFDYTCLELDMDKWVTISKDSKFSSDGTLFFKIIIKTIGSSVYDSDVIQRRYVKHEGRTAAKDYNSESLSDGIYLDDTASSYDDYYKDCIVRLAVYTDPSDTGDGVIRDYLVTAYDGATKKLTVDDSSGYYPVTKFDSKNNKTIFTRVNVKIFDIRWKIFIDGADHKYYLKQNDTETETGFVSSSEWQGLNFEIKQSDKVDVNDSIIVGVGEWNEPYKKESPAIDIQYIGFWSDSESNDPVCQFHAGTISKQDVDGTVIAKMTDCDNDALTAIINSKVSGGYTELRKLCDDALTPQDLEVTSVLLTDSTDKSNDTSEKDYTINDAIGNRTVKTSMIAEPESTTFGAVIELEDKNGDITGIIEGLGGFIIFQQKAISSYLIGTSRQIITDKLGCIAPRSITKSKGGTYFLDDSGEFWRWDFAGSPFLVNRQLLPWFKKEIAGDTTVENLGNHIIDTDHLDQTEALYNANLNMVFLALPTVSDGFAYNKLLLAYDEKRDQWYRVYSELFENNIYSLFDYDGTPAVATPSGLFTLMSKGMYSCTEGEDWKFASQFITEFNPTIQKHVKHLVFTNSPPEVIIGSPTMTVNFRRNWLPANVESFQSWNGTRPPVSTVEESVRPHAGIRGLSWQFILEGKNFVNISNINIHYRPIKAKDNSWAE